MEEGEKCSVNVFNKEILNVSIDTAVNTSVTNYTGSELQCDIRIAGYDKDNKLVSLSGSVMTIPVDENVNIKSSLYDNAVKYVVSVTNPENTVTYAMTEKTFQ